jgi:hypothetical protein
VEFISRTGDAIAGTEPDRYFYLVSLASLILFLALVAGSIRFRRVLPLPAIAYSLALLGSILLYSNVGPRPRMFLSVFPLFLPLSIAVMRRKPWIVLAAVLSIFTALSILFAFLIMYAPAHVTA